MESAPEITQEQILQELLKSKTDEELHKMPEDELLDLISYVLYYLRREKKTKMKEEVKTIYV